MKVAKNTVAYIQDHKRALMLLGIIIFFGAFLRFYNLGDNSFVADEFLDINATYGYVQNDERRSWDFNTGEITKRQNAASDERAWLYREQVATFFQFLPPTEFVARSVSALWGIVGIMIVYFVTLSFTRSRAIALIAAFLIAVSVPVIEIDRKIRMYAMFAPIFLLFSWSLFQFLETGRTIASKKKDSVALKLFKNYLTFNYLYLVPTTLLGIIAFHLHPIAANIIFVLLVYFVIMAARDLCQKRSLLSRYAMYAFAMIVGTIGIKVCAPQQWAWFLSTMEFFENHWSYSEHILRNYWHPLLGAALMIAGGWQLIKNNAKTQRNAGIWIVCNFIVILLAGIFLWKRNVGPQYIVFIQSFGLILAAAGMYALLSWVKRLTLQSNLKATLITTFLLLLLTPQYAYFFERNNTYHLKSDAETPNYREVFVFVKKDFTEGDALITRNFRNYYFSGFEAVVYDFGSERSEQALAKEGKVKKMTLQNAQEIIAQHERGWIVYSDNDEQFIEKELQQYLEDDVDERIIKIDNVNIRGKINVYQWGSDGSNE